VCCGWRTPPTAHSKSKHVKQFPDINKLCNVASCWVYEYTGILLGVHSILYISRIRVKYSQEQATGSCTEESGEREVSFGVICESNLRRPVFIDIACRNAVGKLAFMALNI
jgi:hypothetical protein